MSGDIPPLPQYAFMAWCLVKAQGQLYLYLSNLKGRYHLEDLWIDGRIILDWILKKQGGIL
jgi:hypothetical protein